MSVPKGLRTADRIVEYLRRQEGTIDEIAKAMRLTRSSVRAHLAALREAGVVEERGERRGVSKPARLYGVSSADEVARSRVYAPLLAELLRVLDDRLPPSDVELIMRDAGRGLVGNRVLPPGDLGQRVRAAQALLAELGAATEASEHEGHITIRGYGCPLSAAAAHHTGACVALESFLSTYLSASVVSRCNEQQRRHCLFEVSPSA